jgi:hypoxanthine-DNA glycosylase
MQLFSFPPISYPSAEILILGTMPGAKSLQLNQYYGHGGNHFWKIIFDVFNEAPTKDYERRKAILIERGLALWDVLKACEREGSADSAIEAGEPNDFGEFIGRHPQIRLVAFNGKNAAAFFQQHVTHKLYLPSVVLPSTSSANGWLTYRQKLEEWRKIVLGGFKANHKQGGPK